MLFRDIEGRPGLESWFQYRLTPWGDPTKIVPGMRGRRLYGPPGVSFYILKFGDFRVRFADSAEKVKFGCIFWDPRNSKFESSDLDTYPDFDPGFLESEHLR